MTSEPAEKQKDAPAVRESLFLKVADYVSAAMGRPTNIMIWLLAVIIWTSIFAFGGSRIASGTWLPAWFTSQGFNFPLNLITTVAELFIGFLVAAASNRSERNLEATLAGIQQSEDRDEQIEANLTAAVAVNTELTQKVHDLTAAVHQLLSEQSDATRPVVSLHFTGTKPPAPEQMAEIGHQIAMAVGQVADEPAPT
jgi:low affinity Fe/Cu permease